MLETEAGLPEWFNEASDRALGLTPGNWLYLLQVCLSSSPGLRVWGLGLLGSGFGV